MIQERIIRGEVSGRSFQLGREIGMGSNSIVYGAHEGVNDLAVKIPDPLSNKNYAEVIALDAEYRTQFAANPHITPVVVFDTTRDLHADLDVPFLVMPRADTSLDIHLAHAPVGDLEILDLAEQTGLALADMHEHGLIHYDVNASNVLKFTNQVGDDWVRSWQINDLTNVKKINKASDVLWEQTDWARNIIYPAVTRMIVYPGTDVMPAPTFAQYFSPHRPTRFHDVMEEVMNRAMEPEPKDRYSSMGDLVYDLQTRRALATEAAKKEKRIL